MPNVWRRVRATHTFATVLHRGLSQPSTRTDWRGIASDADVRVSWMRDGVPIPMASRLLQRVVCDSDVPSCARVQRRPRGRIVPGVRQHVRVWHRVRDASSTQTMHGMSATASPSRHVSGVRDAIRRGIGSSVLRTVVSTAGVPTPTSGMETRRVYG